jgi:hypothetical protein
MIYISKLNGCKFIANNVLNVTVFSAINPVGNQNDGVITIAVTGGRQPYLYSIDNGKTFQNSNVFAGLGVGKYVITVKDQFNNLGWVSKFLYENVDCGLYSGSTLQDIIDTNKRLENFLNCTLDDFI